MKKVFIDGSVICCAYGGVEFSVVYRLVGRGCGAQAPSQLTRGSVYSHEWGKARKLVP